MSINYHIYTHKPLDASLTKLIEQKESRKYNVRVIDVHSHPGPSHEMIRNHVLDTRPDYVLLVGDSTTLPGYPRTRNDGVNYQSDAYFSTPDGEKLPLIPTGRLSSMDPVEIERICQVLVSYPSNPDTQWKQRVVLTGWLPRGRSHSGYNTDCAVQCMKEASHYFSIHFKFERKDDSDPEALQTWGAVHSSKDSLKRTIEYGAAIVRYVGHGNEDIWGNIGHDEDFKKDDIVQLDLNHGMLPFIISASCITGSLSATPSFAEVWQTYGKAIGILGSDQEASTWIMDRLPQCIFHQIVTRRKRSVGRIILDAKRLLLDRYSDPGKGRPSERDYHTLQQFRYFGDPDTELAIPAPEKRTLEETSEGNPAVAATIDRIIMVWRGVSNNYLNVLSSTDGTNFGNKVTLPETSHLSPAAFHFNGKFVIAWIGVGNLKINIITSEDGQAWSNKITLSETSDSPPALTFFGHHIYLAWRGRSNNKLNVIRSADGRQWGGKITLQEKTWSGPALMGTGDHLILCWRGGPTNNKLNVMASPDGRIFRSKQVLSEKTPARPALLKYPDEIVLAWRGVGNNYLNISTGNESYQSGATFGGTKITWRERCAHGGPSLTYYRTDHGLRLFAAWTGTDRRLNVMSYPIAHWEEYTPM